MGAGPWSLLTVLFRVIPRFTPSSTAPGVCGQRQSQPATVRPDSYDPNLENHHTGDHHNPEFQMY